MHSNYFKKKVSKIIRFLGKPMILDPIFQKNTWNLRFSTLNIKTEIRVIVIQFPKNKLLNGRNSE